MSDADRVNDPSTKPIPRELAEAFGNAVWAFADDLMGKSDPPVGKYGSITGVCDLVSDFDDALLEEIFHKLQDLMDATMTAEKAELAKDYTYRVGARCLRKLVQLRAQRRPGR